MKGLLEGDWVEVLDGDPRAVAIFKRHYTAREGADYLRYGFSGKGESMILITLECDALFCWRKVEGEGLNCSVFRNEGNRLSSELIKQAVELARVKWPDENRFYTYVAPKEVKGDGACFKHAGWDKLPKRTKKNRLVELEYNLGEALEKEGEDEKKH